MSNTYQREVAVFEAALEMSPVERRAYLEQACAGDAQLLKRVLGLLELHETNRGALGAAGSDPPRPVGASFAHSEKPGDLIGPYKLLQQIGEGGCGVVYMAEQEAPIRRRVALKIIKLGMDTRQVIARFEAERQALALMDHPNIAKVHDAGATATGRPYFVMELVRGVKITDYCDEKKLSTHQRLELFTQVCQAVQHAHQKGIIHRDLKPSNILVAVNDGVAVPKLLDFGIAKATSGERLTDKTLFTAFEQFIGTPAYMSPEQAEVTNVDIDTRSDIYSLGVLLYELLTGQTPFDAKELLKAGLDEMRRTLREKEPARPSTRLSTLGADELTTTANRRGLEGPKLANVLRGDLDWIVMKCLEKDRARRYETANGLAIDIQRHLCNEPVAASPPGKLYRFQKFVRRNKATVATACVLLVCVLAGLGGAIWGFFKERETRRAVQALRAQEHTLLQKAQATIKIVNAKATYIKGSFDEAERMLNEIPSSALEPDTTHANLRLGLAWWHAINQDWDRAAGNLTRLNRPEGPGTAQDAGGARLNRATVLAQKNDRAEYDSFRRTVLAPMLETTNLADAESVCKFCLLVPADGAVLKRLTSLIDVLSESPAEQSVSAAKDAWRHENLGLFNYRLGRFDKAVQECRAAFVEPHFPERESAVNAILAMSYHQLHQPDKARAALALARQINSDAGDVGAATYMTANGVRCWALFEGLFAQVLIREAGELIEGRARAEDRFFAGAELGLAVCYREGWLWDKGKADYPQALKWCRRASEHGSLQAANALAWWLATCRDAEVRNGTNAVRYAETCVAATQRKDPSLLDTLAAACAEAGQFDKAIANEKEALTLNPPLNLRNELELHLKMYESGKPLRE